MPVVRTVVAEREVGAGLYRRINRQLARLGAMGAGAAAAFEARDGIAVVTCRLEPVPGDSGREAGEVQEIFLSGIASALAETIASDVEPRLLRRAVSKRAGSTREAERRRIEELARLEVDRIARDERSERANLAVRIAHYLAEADELHLEGFLRFRLKGYRNELELCAEDALRTFEAEREQREFVALLRFLLENQEPRIDLVHVIPRRGGSFSLRDGDGFLVNHDHLEGFVFDLAHGGDVNPGDLLVSALVTLSPLRIVLHPPPEPWDEAFLREVFRERLIDCEGCALCTQAPAARKPGPL